MKTKTNLFIVDDDKLSLTMLKNSLSKKFGQNLQISTFTDGESCVKHIDAETDIVILDYFMKHKNGLDTLKLIKSLNPRTEVIILSSNVDEKIFLSLFKFGAKDCITKGRGSVKKLYKPINYIITKPIRDMINEYSISKYLMIFLAIFALLGLIACATSFLN